MATVQCQTTVIHFPRSHRESPMASVGHHHHHHRHPPPNYVNPQTRPPWVQATCIIYMILGIGTLLLRLYTRVRFGHRVWMDDVLAVSGTVYTRLATLSVHALG